MMFKNISYQKKNDKLYNNHHLDKETEEEKETIEKRSTKEVLKAI